jgi:hypothetical protein
MDITTVILNTTKGNNFCFKYIKVPAELDAHIAGQFSN